MPMNSKQCRHSLGVQHWKVPAESITQKDEFSDDTWTYEK